MLDVLIEDGNFKRWVRVLFVFIGTALVVITIALPIKSLLGMILFLSGLVIAAIGGYSAQANTLRIKPFDNSYQKARESYSKREFE